LADDPGYMRLSVSLMNKDILDFWTTPLIWGLFSTNSTVSKTSLVFFPALYLNYAMFPARISITMSRLSYLTFHDDQGRDPL